MKFFLDTTLVMLSLFVRLNHRFPYFVKLYKIHRIVLLIELATLKQLTEVLQWLHIVLFFDSHFSYMCSNACGGRSKLIYWASNILLSTKYASCGLLFPTWEATMGRSNTSWFYIVLWSIENIFNLKFREIRELEAHRRSVEETMNFIVVLYYFFAVTETIFVLKFSFCRTQKLTKYTKRVGGHFLRKRRSRWAIDVSKLFSAEYREHFYPKFFPQNQHFMK